MGSVWTSATVAEETVEAVRLVPRERVKQRTALQMVREFFDMFTSKEARLAGLHAMKKK